jgi:hypothetical protein
MCAGEGANMDETGLRRFMVWASITTFCRIAVWLLTPVMYIWTLYLGYLTSFPTLLAAIFIPAIPQIYFIWILGSVTGTLFHPFALLCLTWVVLAVVGIFARVKAVAVT